jgi:hypothetical protein
MAHDEYEAQLETLRLAMIEPLPRINPFSGKPYQYAPSEYDPQRERFTRYRNLTPET